MPDGGRGENKVYFFHGKHQHWGHFIAAKTFKNAKTIALGADVCAFCDNPFIDIRGRLLKENYWNGEYHGESRTVRTDYKGKLNVKQIGGLGKLWFDCPECGRHDFEFSEKIDDDYHYMTCNNCGYEGEVPYVT